MDDQLRDAIRALAGTKLTDEVFLVPCTVESVDLDTLTCNCVAVGGIAVTDIPGVALCAEVDDGFIQVPKVGSVVLVILSKRQKPFIALYSELESILVDVGNSSIDITNDKIKLNNGSFGGLIKIADLVDKLNTIENKVNDIISSFNSHSHSGNNVPPTVPITGTLTPTDRSELENTTIIHGDHGE